jgi:GDPmannose 4,6-dehydratase
MAIAWRGEGVNETGVDQNGHVRVSVDPGYFRPTEVDLLLGDATKAADVLGWKHTTSFTDMVKEMVDSDLEMIVQEAWRKDLYSH